MDGYVLVINAGSSSIKFSVYRVADRASWTLDTRGQVDGIGTSLRLRVDDGDGVRLAEEAVDGRDGEAAFDAVAAWLRLHYGGAPVLGVGHRVVHGGERYVSPAIVTPDVLANLRALIPLAPLHQPFNLAAIDAVAERLPGVPQVACFDTAFHCSVPSVATVVPLPREFCRDGVQRYGFHGLSYEYIASALPAVAPDIARGRVIVAHLGSGASLCAMKDGTSVDHTFGFTALDGLCMGTRPGAMDPGAVLYLVQAVGLSPKDLETVLYRKSGLLGISGISNDMRDLLRSRESGARLAVAYFVYRAVKEIGALAAVLGGLDALVFTAGIGEHSADIRKRVCEGCRWLGLELNHAANDGNGPQISSPGSRVSAWVVPTNEELMIARHTGALLGLTRPEFQFRGEPQPAVVRGKRWEM